MSLNLLVTGAPGSGKTTIIRRAVAQLDCAAGGFYTAEIRPGRRRLGFKLITLDGREAVMAHVDLDSPHKVSRYAVDVSVIDRLGAETIRAALVDKQLVVIDEIGPMEILSSEFRRAVEEALEAGASVLGSVVQRRADFTDRIKQRGDVELLEIRPANRDRVLQELVGRLQVALGPGSP